MNQSKMISAIKRMSENVTQTFDVDAHLLGVLKICMEIAEAHRGALYITDQSGDLILRAQEGYSSESLFNAREKISYNADQNPYTLLEYVFKEGKHIILNSEKDIKDKFKDLIYLTKLEPLITNANIRCCNWAGIPIKKENHGYPIGVITLQNASDEPSWRTVPNQEQEFILELIGTISGSMSKLSEHNTRMYEAVRKLMETTSVDKDIDRNINNVLKTFDEITRAFGTSIWLIDGWFLNCRYATGHYRKILEKEHEPYKLNKNPEEGPIGLTAYIAKSGEVLHFKTREQEINHPQYVETMDEWLYPEGLNPVSFLGAPLKFQGYDPIGVIISNKLSTHSGNNFFTEEEAQQFLFLALIVAAVIKNAKDKEQINRTDQMLIQLYEIGTRCNELKGINEILWYFLIGLTNAKGIGVNRVSLFEIQAQMTLRGFMAVGPTGGKEGIKRIQRKVEEKIPEIDLEYSLNAFHENNNNIPKPEGELMTIIDGLPIEIEDNIVISEFISTLNNNEPNAQRIVQDQLNGKLATFLSTLDFNEGVVFGLRLSDGRGFIGICDYLYTPALERLPMHEIIRLVIVFLKQIQLAIQHLELTNNEQQVRERALQEFRATSAHRIGTEIADITGALRRLRPLANENSDDSIRKAYQRIESALARVKSTVTDYGLLAINRPLHYKRINLNDLINSVVNSDFPEKGSTKVLVHFAGSFLLYTYADEQMLTYVFHELLHNAFKALSGKSDGLVIIDLDYDEKDKNIIIKFSDNGFGIPPVNQNRIFEEGFTTRVNGTGMGLFIVSKYIKSHKGNIMLEDKDKGCNFLITLPIKEQVPLEGIKILVVDDNLNLANDIRAGIIEHYPTWKIDIATTKTDAESLIDQYEWDIVITDMSLSEDDLYGAGGMELLRKIHDKNLPTKTIMVTAHAQLMVIDDTGHRMPAIDRCKNLGAFDYIYRNRPDGDYINDIVDAVRRSLMTNLTS